MFVKNFRLLRGKVGIARFLFYQAELRRSVLTAKEQSLLDALEKDSPDSNVEIVTVEVVGSKKAPTIRVYIDTPEGVSFDQLSSAQAWINDIMDALDPFPGAYTLEVSSPGIDRPLRTPAHFVRFAGEKVYITCVKPQEGRSRWRGTLRGFEDGCVLVETEDGTTVALDLDNIKSDKVKGTIDFNA